MRCRQPSTNTPDSLCFRLTPLASTIFDGRRAISLSVSMPSNTERMSIAALPRVRGRHRNKALAAARRARAVELRCEGWTYKDIADELGYAHKGTVHAIVQQALAAQEIEDVGNLRAIETARLDRLQYALWGRAMTGEVAAITQCRRIIEARVRLLGLVEKAAAERVGCRTVVCSCVPGTGHRANGGAV